jgi:cysteine desulfuration protein SufE
LKSIDNIQDEIIEEFSMLQEDLDMCVEYLIELGKKNNQLSDEFRIEENIVKGCQSKVWLVANYQQGTINFMADSNTLITKGLVGMLLRVFSGQKPRDILKSDLYFIHNIGMSRFIGTQRSNGFAAMIKQMKLYALAFLTKEEQKKKSP